MESLLASSPQELGDAHTRWTVPLLLEALEIATGQRVSDDTLRRLNFVWKRPCYDCDPEPQREKKTGHPQANPGLAAPQRRAAQDETDLLLFPPLRAGWSKRGGKSPGGTRWTRGGAREGRHQRQQQYGTIEQQGDRFLNHLRAMAIREALHTAGVLSRGFWLQGALSKVVCGPA